LGGGGRVFYRHFIPTGFLITEIERKNMFNDLTFLQPTLRDFRYETVIRNDGKSSRLKKRNSRFFYSLLFPKKVFFNENKNILFAVLKNILLLRYD
jgi:hypothetical protein